MEHTTPRDLNELSNPQVPSTHSSVRCNAAGWHDTLRKREDLRVNPPDTCANRRPASISDPARSVHDLIHCEMQGPLGPRLI